ncbi:MAG: GNAT family protein [Flavobacteriales bacterium]
MAPLTTLIALTGKHVALEPLSLMHHDELCAATRDGELWTLWYTIVPSPEDMRAEIERRLVLHQQGSMLPFAVRHLASGRVVGMTTYMNIDEKNRRVEIGSTWYARSVQRSALNTECKLLLLTHAFETLECIAVEFRTSFFNHQSRRAIERIGAKQDGMLRNHMRMPDGTLRDTCVYSILPSEWPGVKKNLLFRLAAPDKVLPGGRDV